MSDSSISDFLLVSEPVSSVLLVAFGDGGGFAGFGGFLVFLLISESTALLHTNEIKRNRPCKEFRTIKMIVKIISLVNAETKPKTHVIPIKTKSRT